MQLDLDAYEYRVVTVLLSFRWETDSEIFPRISLIASMVHCAERTVQRVISRLETKGYLVVEERYRDDGGQTSNRYILAGDLAAAVSGVDALRVGGRVTARQSTVAHSAHQEGRPRTKFNSTGQSKGAMRPPTDTRAYFHGPYAKYIHH